MIQHMNSARAIRIRLTPAMLSALECAGIELGDDDTATLRRCWSGHYVTFTDADRDALFSEINDRSNAEDGAAEHELDPAMRTFAARAAKSLCALASRVLREGNAR
jgi:hypothetical protein